MKKITVLLIAMIACLCGLQLSAQPAKGPSRSAIYPALPPSFIALGTYNNPSHLYYSTQEQHGIPIGYVNGLSIIGEVDGKYYSSTYARLDNENDGIYSNPGAGFVAAMKVEGGILGNESPIICNSQTGTERNSVSFSARVERAGEYAARIVYTLTSTALLTSRTVSLGVYADIMIGDNDSAAIYCLRNEQGKVYGLDMKYKKDEDAEPGEKIPVFTAIFDGASGVTPVDDWWFGQYTNNYKASEIVGNYDNVPDVYVNNQWVTGTREDEFYKVEGGNYDSGMGFCWKNITLQPGESVQLSYLVSVSEIDIDEPEPDPEAEYHVEVYNTEAWNDLPADHPAHVWGYYKHPFDWASHIEYMVDGDRGTGEWTAIPGELAPNSEFDLPFNLNFNPDVTDIHTLKLRLVDIEGNYTYLTDLDKEWEDVRTIPLTANPETQYYDGTPKTFVVNVGGVFDYTLGENGEYVEPGTYDFSIYGDYDMGTIGVNTVEFSIVRRQATVNVQVPEDCVYDGNEHPATATTDGDGTVIITYKDAEGNISTDAPVEPGTYEVFVEVTKGEICDGIENKSYGTFTIDKAQSEITYTVPEDCVYDGEAHAATAQLVAGDGVLTITYVNTETGDESENAPVEPGTYNVVVTVTETAHYYGLEETVGTFTIDKAQSRIIYGELQDVNYDGKPHGADVTLVEGDGDLIVIYEDTATGARSLTPPTEEGNYDVYVIVTETDHYYGIAETKIGNFSIIKKHTGINELNVDAQNDGAWYTIDGRRVAAPTQTGIYIHNGKKYYVK